MSNNTYIVGAFITHKMQYYRPLVDAFLGEINKGKTTQVIITSDKKMLFDKCKTLGTSFGSIDIKEISKAIDCVYKYGGDVTFIQKEKERCAYPLVFEGNYAWPKFPAKAYKYASEYNVKVKRSFIPDRILEDVLNEYFTI